MTMTPKQLRELADKLEEEERNKITKEGYLKHDLYINYDVYLPENHTFIFTKNAFDEFIKSIKKEFDIVKKGTKFIRYEEDCWFDDICFGLEELSEEWANEHLENIKDVK